MLNNNLQVINVSNLDLEFTYPCNFNQNNISSFIDEIKKIDKLPFSKGEFYYSQDSWDFSPYTSLNLTKRTLRFNFKLSPRSFISDIKNYVLLRILEGKLKVQTIFQEFIALNEFFKHVETCNVFSMDNISIEEIKSFLYIQETRGCSVFDNSLKTLKKFYKNYLIDFRVKLSFDLKILLDYKPKKTTEFINEHKFPDIPRNYFAPFLDACVKIAEDKQQDDFLRAIASLYIILSQTGLRISECLYLHEDDLKPFTFNNKTIYYLNYRTWKKEKANNYSIHKTFVNELSKKAFDILVDMYKEERKKYNLKYLYLGSKKSIHLNTYPVSEHSFEYAKYILAIHLDKYFPIINVDENFYVGIKNKKLQNDKLKKKYPHIKTIAFPANHQFRVHVCTELFYKGVPINFIQKFMSHLDETFTYHYVRSNPNEQENIVFSANLLREVIKGELNLLGPSKSLIANINKYIKENNYNVETDLEAIVSGLMKKLPIRERSDGVCIKSSMQRDCSIDAKVNEFHCAFGICPNIFHFFYMVDITYDKTKELVKSIKLNIINGFKRQAEKELYMLDYIITKKLEVELLELKKEIAKKGLDALVEKYKNLKDFVLNLDNVEKEISTWKTLKSSKQNLDSLAKIITV